jgi:phytoene dehydrogenase-like protein
MRRTAALAAAVLLGLAALARCRGDAAPPVVCVVGGGVAGAATAHYLRGTGAAVTVFDAGRAPGGRVASAALAPGLAPAEAGASVVAAQNRCVRALVDAVGLEAGPPAGGGGGGARTGLWDGLRFRYVFGAGRWPDAVAVLWRYGVPLLRMRRYVARLLRAFDALYDGADEGYETVEALLARAPGLYALTQRPFAETAEEAFGGGPLIEELVSAVRRAPPAAAGPASPSRRAAPRPAVWRADLGTGSSPLSRRSRESTTTRTSSR